MKMTLGIKERFLLREALSLTGDAVTMRVIDELHKALAFSEEEQLLIGLKTDEERPGSITWDPECTYEAEIEIGPAALGVIRTTLGKRDAERTLTRELLPLYERFVETAEKPETGESSDA